MKYKPIFEGQVDIDFRLSPGQVVSWVLFLALSHVQKADVRILIGSKWAAMLSNCIIGQISFTVHSFLAPFRCPICLLSFYTNGIKLSIFWYFCLYFSDCKIYQNCLLPF